MGISEDPQSLNCSSCVRTIGHSQTLREQDSPLQNTEETRTMHNDKHFSALKFITCGSVDDGKSTLIGRLLVDTKAVLQDHLAGVQRSGETDLALLMA